MPVNPLALRWKIGALVAAAAGAVALVIVLVVHQTSHSRIIGEGESYAGDELDKTIQNLQRGTGEPPIEGSELPAQLRREAKAGRTAFWYDDESPAGERMWAATVYQGRPVGIWVDMSADMLDLRALDRHLLEAVLAALLIVVPASALATELSSRRLRRVARTARRIAGGDLDCRIGHGGRTRDEITEISAAVDSMAGALQDRLRREQWFTADVAHELRTPLMGLITAAELLPDGRATGYVRDRIQVLNVLVEALLEISRLDAGAERAEPVRVPLAAFLADSVRGTGLKVRLDVPGDPVVETDPRRLDRIIANLVINAHRHGSPPVELTVAGSMITVRDHGPGFPADLLAEGPQRFRIGAHERGRGHGLGLTIAQGQAEVIGARLEFSNAPDGGAVAAVRL
ncbi:sensor histidine kinase [Actinomadura madurae]|uniref:sensor histidine kinase n=1 Tax=Actinomadura madurae TaxID=1993 RepID=UPI000D81C37F|nr:HAMP domain-containing sensor histidine kinase [Actinomadura madurae]SPT51256.1 Sensor protein CseC [Actinomadura madurae]